MKKLPLLMLLLVSFAASAQHPLSQGRRTSVYDYIYELTNDETLQIYRVGIEKVNSSFLHTLKDSFPHGNNIPDNIPPGNYLKVYAENDKLETRFTPISDVQVKLLDNMRDLVVILHDKKGNLIKDAVIKVGKHTLVYDPTANNWRLEKYEGEGVLEVYHKGALQCVLLKRNDTKVRKPYKGFKRILHPSGWTHKRKAKQNKPYYSRYSDPVTAYEKKFAGYLVSNKPQYKPQDTIKLKAFITDQKGKPVSKPLILRLSTRDLATDTILTTLTPTGTPGAYYYEFVPFPEMDIDEDYYVTLETTESRKYDLNTYDGDLEDYEYVALRKVLMRGTFRLEEYELHALNVTARTDKGHHSGREQVAFYCQAKDENDLTVMDGRIELSVTLANVSKYYENDMLIPDTLWRYSGDMDAVGETKILLPDSIFPKADFTYYINYIFKSSDNDYKKETLYQQYSYCKDAFSFKLKNDSLYVTREDISEDPQRVNVYGLNAAEDTVEAFTIMLPAAIKVNPFLSEYKFNNQQAEGVYELSSDDGHIETDISWHKDTVTLKLKNPQRLFFWYTIFKHNNILLHGYGDHLSWSGPTHHGEQYEARIHYIWNGKLREGSSFFTDPGNPLDVSLITPLDVYPGQTTQITINVKDKYQQPVAGADLTSYAYTSKFTKASVPGLPTYQPAIEKRKHYFVPHTANLNDLNNAFKLDWLLYKKKMGLDSLLFFSFTHPSPYFVYKEPVADTITQIAPFVFSGGSIQPVHILSVDEIPVYSSLSSPLQPYSIRVTPGNHWITLRTLHQRISFHLTVTPGVKTFVSIDSAIKWKDFRVEDMPLELTAAELQQIGKYMLQVKNTFGNSPAYIKQDGKLHWLNNPSNQSVSYSSHYITGPLTGKNATFFAKDYLSQDFTPEPGYAFEINKGLIKQKQISDLAQRYKYLPLFDTDTSLSAMAWTEKMADSLIHATKLYKLRSSDVVNGSFSNYTKNKLIINLEHSGLQPNKDIAQFLFFRGDDPSFVRSYKGSTTAFRGLDTGYYKLVVLLTDLRYFIKDSLLIRQNHIRYYAPENINLLPEDSSSIEIHEKLMEMVNFNVYERPDRQADIAENFNNRNFNTAGLTRIVYGVVEDAKGDPIPGAIVALKGTSSRCIADAKGRFRLSTTTKGTLWFSSIGMHSTEQRLDNKNFYKIVLTDLIHELDETVVVAYATTTKRYSVGNATTIKTDLTDNFANLQIRGKNSTDPNSKPLIIVDGIPYNGSLDDLSPEDIKNIDILKDDEATGIYGSRAANGVIIITTNPEGKPERPELLASTNTLRTNFRDDAFWQPKLKTDANGNASFKVTFPDDITNWSAYAIAMTDKKQAGMRKIQIRSFKSLSGNLALPAFVVAGDSLHVISKALNYMPDSINISHTFSMNDSLYKQNRVGFKNAFIDTVPVLIPEADSVSFKYTLNKDGYMDGEQRKVPVVARGTEETTGFFIAMHKDTTLSYEPVYQAPVIVHAESAILPVLMEEATQIQQYKYLCNEQLASKLKACLLEKKVCTYLKKDFRKEKDISDILKRLDNQKTNSLWGWWENSPVSLWISRHVIEALLMAEEQGYKINFNKQTAISHFIYELESGRENDSIGCMQLLLQLGAKINYSAYTDDIIARSGKSGYDTIRLAVLQRSSGQPLNFTPILAREKTTALGNAYWGKDNYDLFDNSIQRTLQVYKLLRKAGGYDQLLQRMRGYFLEQRKGGHWRNTYESSLILETILPDVLADESKGPVSLSINGTTVTQFPYTDTISSAGKINISKQGQLPVYFTAYQQFFNREPEKISGLFTISSVFSSNNTEQAHLNAGVPVTLKVEVTAQKTADYVLIEIPIPAGCSYIDKSQSWVSNEVHREHFKDKVSIFCSRLRPGKHTFNVSLLPRYSGRYYLNPAKAEMQYFPVFMGREALKKVYIH